MYLKELVYSIQNLVKLLGFDDNDYAGRIKFRFGLDIILPEHNYKLFVVHQHHSKGPRPHNLFLKSYDKYRIIKNTKMVEYSKNHFTSKVLDFNYNEIDESNFIEILNTKTINIINLHCTQNDRLNIKFLRKYLKYSNFRLISK